MSQENVEALQRAIEAYNRGDKAAWVAEVHLDAKTFPTPDWPEQGPFIGAEAWDFYERAEEIWGDTSRPAPQEWEIIDAGDTIFAVDPRSTALAGFNRSGGFFSSAPKTRLPNSERSDPSARPLKFLPSRTTTASTSVVPSGWRVNV